MAEKTRVKRVALYIRVSSLEQAQNGHSLKMQQDELERWCKENNCIIHDYYIDDGFTATSLKRPELQRMLDESSEYDMIIFIKLDRFSRGVGNYYKIMERLNATKTDWKAIFEEYDTTTANGRFMINIYLSMAEQEAALASERTKAVFLSRIKNGECALTNLPKGYKRVMVDGIAKMKIDETQVDYLRACFKHFKDYGSMRKTMQYIKEEFGVEIPKRSFKHIITNKIYIGTYVNEDIGEFPNFCDPIVTEKDFYDVQALIKKNAKVYNDGSPQKHLYIFAGMLFCHKCGRKLGGRTSGDKRVSKDYRRKFYGCTKHQHDKGCENKYPMPEKRIEAFLLENVRHLLEDKIISYNIEREKANTSPTIKLKKHADKIKSKMSKLKELYLDDIIQREEYELDYKKYDRELSEISSQIERTETAEKHFDVELYKSFLKQDFEDMYQALKEDEKRRLWLSVIDSITIGKGIIEPKFF